MANWFESAAQSLGNFVTGHGFEDNSQRATMDAQEAERKKKEQQAALNQPVIQQRPASQPQAPNNILTMPTMNIPSAQPVTQTIVQQPTAPQPQPGPTIPTTPPNGPRPLPTVNNFIAPIPTINIPHAAPAPVSNGPNIFQKVGGFFSDAAHNIGNAVNDYQTNPNNTPRNVLDYIFGVKNPLDGATLDYSHMVNGKPTLVPKAAPTNFSEAGSQSLGGDIVNKMVIAPTLDIANTLTRVPQTAAEAIAMGTGNNDAAGNIDKVFSKLQGFIGGLESPNTNAEFNQVASDVSQGKATPSEYAAAIGNSLGAASVVPISRLLSAPEDVARAADSGVSVASKEAPKQSPTIDTLPPEPTVTPTAPEVQPKLPNNIIKTAPTQAEVSQATSIIGKIRAGGTATKEQFKTIAQTVQKIRNTIARQDSAPIRQVDTVTPPSPDVPQTPVSTADIINPTPETAPTTAVSDATGVPSTTDLANPGAVPADGVISSNPTKADITNIIDNTVNPTAPVTKTPKLTPQNEMQSVKQADVNNLTGELGVNKNGQVYQKVSQAQAKDVALKNLLDGKTPQEYLATAKQTGQADSAELAILLERTPTTDPVWGELASLKGKLGTQKGQALALLERTMRKTATADQLASRTLQKANTAGFDTTAIAGDIQKANKAFTDARDAYNKVLNDPKSTNADIQAAKDVFYRETKQSFTNEGNILNKVAKTKEQKNLAYQLQKKSDVYLQGIATSSLTSSPTSVLRNFTQGVGALTHQAGLAPKVEALINRIGGGSKIGSFDTAGAKVGFKTGAGNLRSEFATRASQLGLTKNPASWLRHPIGTIRQLTTTGTELGNIPMEAAIRGGMSSEYKQILKSQGFKGPELKTLTERNTITDPLDIRAKYAKEINDLNGLSSEVDRTGGTFRENIKNGFTKLGVTDRTSAQLADFVDRDIFGFFKPTLIVGKKTADYATGGVAHLVPAISKLARGDKAGFVNEISKTIATGGVTLPVWGATGYALAKAGVLTQNDYGEWQINGVPISGYVGAFGGPLAMGAIVGENQANGKPPFDGFADKAYKTLANVYPYGEVGQKLGSAADVLGGVFGDIKNGQQAYGFKEGTADILSGLIKENVPASSFLNTLTKMLGGNVKNTTVDNPKNANVIDAGIAGIQEAGNKVIAGIPGISNALPDKTNSFGDTIPKPDAGAALLGASNPSIAQSDASTGITPVGSKGLNDVAKTNLTTVDDKTAYNNAVKAIQDAGNSVTDTNVFKELAKSGNYLLAAKYDSNINQSISDADKTALAQYDGMNADHQKVYVQDQKNALDTYTAQLNNKKADGTLSNDDTQVYKVWSGSGNSLLVKQLVAKTNVDNNVPTDVLNLYEQVTTQKEYNNLSTEQRTNLDQYAAELKANGITVRSFLSGGGSGSKAKGASSVPLTKAVTSGGGVGGKFAHQSINVDIPQVVKPAPQYVIKQRKISVG